MLFSFGILLRQTFLLVLLAAPMAVLSGWLHPLAPAWREPLLEPGEVRLHTALGWEDVLWLDARNRADFDEGHIPGARLLNEEEWESLFFDFMDAWDPDRKIVVYCGGAQCQASHQVATRLREDLGGADNVYVLKGGWTAWSRR